MSDGPLIRLQAVTKVFRTEEAETQALAGVHLEIAKGEFVAIAGPPGCGKSTLLSILGLLDSPTTGRYWLNGTPVERLSPAERARTRNRAIGIVFHRFNLIGGLTAYENIELPLRYRGTRAAERRERVERALERVGMADAAGLRPAELSAGQHQRVAIGRAIVGDPLVVLADEPTGNVDARTGEAVMALLREVQKSGATLCVMTHDRHCAAYAGRSMHLVDGRVVEVTVA